MSDLFQNRKCIHLKLSKDIHAELRVRLFKRRMSMQEVFNEFARLIISDDKRVEKLLDEFAHHKAKAQIDKLNNVGRSKKQIDDLDQDALYGLIEAGNNDENA